MKPTSDRHRITGNSYPEIEGEFAVAFARVRLSVRFGGERLRPGHLLNALVLRFLRLTPEQREYEAERWIAELEVLLAETEGERDAAASRLAAAKAAPEPGTLITRRDEVGRDDAKEAARPQRRRPPKATPKGSQ